MSNTNTPLPTEFDDELGYDANHNDESQYCQHGTFIGSWWGPDYLCAWCEDGISADEMRDILIAGRRRAVREAEAKYDATLASLIEAGVARVQVYWVVQLVGEWLINQHRIGPDELV